MNFIDGTAKGGTQPFGSNTNDGRLFRDPNNITASFCPPNPDGSGALVSVASAGVRRTAAGVWSYPSGGTTRILWNRDLTNVAWTATNITAAKNQIGADGSANAASSITATSNGGTITQAVTQASANYIFSVDIRRIVGAGTLEMTIDGGTTWTVINGITSSYTQQFIVQTAVTNPTFGFRIGTSGDSFAVDFCMSATPSNSMNVPNKYRVTTTSATVLTSQSRPSADIADAAPNTLITMARGFFGFYWQGRSERPSACFPITGATGVFCSVLATGSGGAVRFTVNAGVSTTADLTWKVGLTQVNKIAGYFKSDGTVKMAANGVLGSAGSGGTAESALDHWDLSTNGSGANSIYGVSERIEMGANATFTDAQLIAMTT